MKITKEFDISKTQKISIPLWVSDDKITWVQRDISKIEKSKSYPYRTTEGVVYKYASVEKPVTYLTKEEVKEWAEKHRFGYAVKILDSGWVNPAILLYSRNISDYDWCQLYVNDFCYLKFGEPHKFTKEEMEDD